MKKRILSLLLAVCMLFPGNSYLAKAESNEKEGIIEAMVEILPNKEMFGLGDVDFFTLQVGSAIQVYNYVNESFVFSRNAFPLFSGNELVGILYSLEGSRYQFMTGLADKIRETNSANVAIVYDSEGCNVYNGQNFIRIIEADCIDTNKSVLPEELDSLDCGSINLTDLSVHSDLGLANVPVVCSEVDFCLNVPQVLQGSYLNLCWAASIATVVNYKLNEHYTCMSMAVECQGSESDIASMTHVIEGYIQNYLPCYSLSNTIEPIYPSFTVMRNNLAANNPIFSSFRNQFGGHHNTVMVGYTGVGNLYILDPKVAGLTVAFYRSGDQYVYLSSDDNSELILSHMICASWN